MSTYAPGTVAVATVEGVAGVRVMLTENGDWRSAVRIGGGIVHDDSRVTDVRPLVVLDLDDFQWAAMVLRDPKIEAMGTRTRIADQIEAQTKPPRIYEPGLWGVVEAHTRFHPERATYIRSDLDGSVEWLRADGRSRTLWRELVDPTLIREGVES